MCWDDYKMVEVKEKNRKEVPNCVPKNEAQGYQRVHLIKQNGNVNVIDVNSGRVLAKDVKEWRPEQWKKFFREWGIMDVEVRTSDKTFVRDGSYSPKRFLSLVSRKTPQQGQVVPVVQGKPYAITEDNKPYPVKELLSHLIEFFVRQEKKCLEEATYQGKKVQLNKPFRTSGGNKAKSVYVKDGDKVKKVSFGDPNMSVKKDKPERKKSFCSRHNCDDKTDKTKAGYWACKDWNC